MNKQTSTKKDTQKKQGKGHTEKEKTVVLNSSKYQALLKDAAEYKDKYVRLYAEFENARKRMDREKFEFIKYANEGILTEFLGILDDLERSIESAKTNHDDSDAFFKGMDMIISRMESILKSNDIKPIETRGKTFDPHYHEVLMQEESNKHKDGVIIEEFQKGFMLGEKVIRTAKVKVVGKK